MIKKLDHIAIAVRDLEASARTFQQILGIPPTKVQEVPTEKVRVAFFPFGGAEIELVQGLGPGNPVANFIEKRGEGVHHICLEVDDLEGTLARLAAAGVPLLDRTGKPGACGQVAFLHPRGANGVLIELVQRPT
ncbi:MAG: methylmalonyl-CoA epimerase [candidate division NC10 bacterium]|nr:methylmalonyl-CoA epimerase [candidate division NC10 bacterium]MBI4390807.1 methylmalonyl-CoA epimerase [candidate division NC10 bacterium]